ncbi:MAG: hypothetical protein ACRDYU_15300 [Actinomycetes bacterium]
MSEQADTRVAADQVGVDRWALDRLWPAEQRLLAEAVHGRWLNLLPGAVPGSSLDETFDPRDVRQWDGAEAIRGEFLADLVTGRVSAAPRVRKGVRLRGAVIEGQIDLEGWQDPTGSPPSLVLRGCLLHEAPLLDQSHLAWLEISSCALPGLTATQVRVDHNLVLARSVVTGPVTLALARLGGQLDCTGIVVGPAEDAGGFRIAVEAFEARVGADLLLADADCTGSVELGGAEVAGNLSLARCHVRGRRDGVAVSAARVRVHHHVVAMGCRTEGQLDLFGAHVSGSVLLDDAVPVATEGDPRTALDLDHSSIGGELRMCGIAPEGRVSCRGATVTGWLSTDGARLVRPDQRGYVFDGEGLHVGGRLRWCGHAAPPEGVVDLRYADVHRLEDDLPGPSRRGGPRLEPARHSWPGPGLLLLDGMEYRDLLTPGHPRARRAWLALQAGYSAQPYEQLARMYRESGKSRAARDIGIAREECRRTRDTTLRRHERWWSLLLRITTGHGYKPWRILYFLAALLVAAAGILALAQDRDMLVPARDADPAVTAQACTGAYPCFSQVGYAFETVVPLINLHQVESWSVDASAPHGTALRITLWGLTVLGWVFVSLAVAGITSAMRHT